MVVGDGRGKMPSDVRMRRMIMPNVCPSSVCDRRSGRTFARGHRRRDSGRIAEKPHRGWTYGARGPSGRSRVENISFPPFLCARRDSKLPSASRESCLARCLEAPREASWTTYRRASTDRKSIGVWETSIIFGMMTRGKPSSSSGGATVALLIGARRPG